MELRAVPLNLLKRHVAEKRKRCVDLTLHWGTGAPAARPEIRLPDRQDPGRLPVRRLRWPVSFRPMRAGGVPRTSATRCSRSLNRDPGRLGEVLSGTCSSLRSIRERATSSTSWCSADLSARSSASHRSNGGGSAMKPRSSAVKPGGRRRRTKSARRFPIWRPLPARRHTFIGLR